jgi:hypothetical protein
MSKPMNDKPSEHPYLVNASDVEGVPVYDRHGDKLGVVKAVYLDARSGRAEYICLGSGGVLGLGETFYPVPWSALDYDDASSGYRTWLDKASLDAGPGFGCEAGEDSEFAWAGKVRSHYESLRGPDAAARHFTHGTSAATADMAVSGEMRHDEKSAGTPHTRAIDPPDPEEKVDHLAEKVERAEDRQEALLDEGVEESFPASDPVSVKRIT